MLKDFDVTVYTEFLKLRAQHQSKREFKGGSREDTPYILRT